MENSSVNSIQLLDDSNEQPATSDNYFPEITFPLKYTIKNNSHNKDEVNGVFIGVDENGNISQKGFNDFTKLMQRYSSKTNETSRFVFINNLGEIVRHEAFASNSVNATQITSKNDELYEMKDYARKNNLQVIFVHNHPSGVVSPSPADKDITRDFEVLFAENFSGHVILDHGTFGLYSKKNGWNVLKDEKLISVEEYENILKNSWGPDEIHGSSIVSDFDYKRAIVVARKVDDVDTWNNKDFVPVSFITSASRLVKTIFVHNFEFNNQKALEEKIKQNANKCGAASCIMFANNDNQLFMCRRFNDIANMAGSICKAPDKDGNIDKYNYKTASIFKSNDSRTKTTETETLYERFTMEKKRNNVANRISEFFDFPTNPKLKEKFEFYKNTFESEKQNNDNPLVLAVASTLLECGGFPSLTKEDLSKSFNQPAIKLAKLTRLGFAALDAAAQIVNNKEYPLMTDGSESIEIKNFDDFYTYIKSNPNRARPAVGGWFENPEEQNKNREENIMIHEGEKNINTTITNNTVSAYDVWNEVKPIVERLDDYEALKFAIFDYLYNRSVDEAAGIENAAVLNLPRFMQLPEEVQDVLKKYNDSVIDFNDQAMAIKIAGTTNADLHSRMLRMKEEIENRKYVHLSNKEELSVEEQKQNYVLSKLAAAGIEVVTDKEEFDRILESQSILQKMSADLSEVEKLSKQLNEEKSKTKELEETVKKQKSDIQNQNYVEFIEYLDSVKDYIPEEKDFSKKMNIMGNPYYYKLANKIPISFNSNGADEWLVKPDNNSEKKVYIVSSHYSGLRDIYNYEDVKQYFTDNTVLTTFQESLTSFLAKNISLEKEKQKNFVTDLNKQTEELKILEKREARKNVKEWATKENYDLAFLNSSSKITELFGSEIKAIGVLPQEINQIFPSITDYNLYAQKDYFIDHWVNHHSELTESIFDELQNVLDNYDDIYRDPDNGTIIFVKQEGRLNDFLVVEQEDNKLVFYDSTFLRKGIPSRFEKITPVREQELKNTVEVRHISSTARQGLSDPAAGISTLNGNTNISQTTTKSSPQPMVQNGNTYGFAYDGKIYLNPEIASSEVAIHEYTHLWDSYTQRTNPELWEKGKNIFKKTFLWDEVKADPNYADIADNDDLLLSEVHARICGKMAEAVLSRILEKDGELTKDTVIDWDKEVDAYIYETFESSRTLSDGRVIKSTGYGAFGTVVDINAIRSWFAKPMKDLMDGLQITKDVTVEPEQARAETVSSEEVQQEKDESSFESASPSKVSVNNENDVKTVNEDVYENPFKDEAPDMTEEEYIQMMQGTASHESQDKEKSDVSEEKEKGSVSQESSVSESSSKSVSQDEMTNMRFLEIAASCSTIEEYKKFYEENYNFKGRAAIRTTKPESANNCVVVDRNDEQPISGIFKDNPDNRKSHAEYWLENGYEFFIPSLEKVSKEGLNSIKAAGERFCNLMQQEVLPAFKIEKENLLEKPGKWHFERKRIEQIDSPVLRTRINTILDQLETSELSDTIENPLRVGAKMPTWSVAHENEDGTIEFEEMKGYEVLGWEPNISVTLKGGDKTFVMEWTAFHDRISNLRDLYNDLAKDDTRVNQIEKIYRYQDSAGTGKDEMRAALASQFFHNFSVLCRGKWNPLIIKDESEKDVVHENLDVKELNGAKNLQDAVKIARYLYDKLPEEEKKKLKVIEKQYKQKTGKPFEEMLKEKFNSYQRQSLAYKEEEQPGYIEGDVKNWDLTSQIRANEASNYHFIQDGEKLDPNLETKVGDTVLIGITAKNWNGKLRKLPLTSMKILTASKQKNEIVFYDNSKNARYTMPFDTYVEGKKREIEHSNKVEKIKNKILLPGFRKSAKIKKERKKDRKDRYKYGLIEGR